MELDLRQDIAIVTVIGVESFPCSMLGQKKVFTMKGEGQSGNLKLPWNLPMTWLEKQLTELIRRDMPNEMFIVTELINQDEPDQIVKVMIDSYLSHHEHKTIVGVNDNNTSFDVGKEILQKALNAAHFSTPAALATIVKSRSSAYKAGASMLIYRDGQTYGTIGGGYAESQVRQVALNVIDNEKPHIHKVSLSEKVDIADSESLASGLILEVFTEPVKSFMHFFY